MTVYETIYIHPAQAFSIYMPLSRECSSFELVKEKVVIYQAKLCGPSLQIFLGIVGYY